MKNTKISYFILAGIFLIALSGAWLAYVGKSKIELSIQEKCDLKRSLTYLIKDTELGYTLFGTKPVTLLSPECSDETSLSQNRPIFEKSISLLEKIVSENKNGNFCLITNRIDGLFVSTFFINKKLFINTISRNREIFEKFGRADVDPQRLLKTLLENTDFERVVCNNHDALLGICLGYGVQNSLHAERRSEIRKYLARQGTPPWKNLSKDLFDDAKEFLHISRPFSELRCLQPQCAPPLPLDPSPGFATLEEEVRYLQSVMQNSCDMLPPEMSWVQLPLFWCDRGSPETLSILDNYRKEQKLLRQILTSDDISERVLAQLSEE